MKLQTKILLIFPPISLVAIVTIAVWGFWDARNRVYEFTYSQMDLILQESLRNEFERRNRLLVDAHMAQIDFFVQAYQAEAISALKRKANRLDGDFIVLDQEGAIRLSTTGEPTDRVKAHWSDIFTTALSRPHLSSAGYHPSGERPRFYVAAPFPDWQWVIFYTLDTAAVDQAIQTAFWRTVLGTSICVIAAILIISLIARRFLVRRVLLLKDAAARIAQTRRATRIGIEAGDELGELARAMESMSDELQAYDSQQLQMQQELAALNRKLKMAHGEKDRLSKEMDTQLAERTSSLQANNQALHQTIVSIQNELDSAEQSRDQLRVKVAELLLKQSDMVRSNTTVLKQLKIIHDENQVLREQVRSYAALLEQDNPGAAPD